ncbi:MAG: hypothetical protein KatS3mg093_188 [Candidatus Parcubacteria bacterium]|nr:MAG: hypothetical protein KatS3mg093_188 [Candidatus Parcubacteria bacterium]
MKKLINIDLVPNFENDDFEIIKKLLNRSYDDLLEDQSKIEKSLKSYFPDGEILFFSSARGALYFLLSQIKTKSEEHVITQAFSCLVVPLAIKSAGYKPIYVDIDDSFNLSIQDLKNKLTSQTKAIIIQNTFGLPANISEIIKIAKENNLLVIENLTHSLGAKYEKKYLGNFGDVSLLSFNRNKVISSIIGGALIIKNQEIKEKLKQSYLKLSEIDESEIKKILFTGKIFYLAKQNYNIIMKIFLKFLRKKNYTLEMVSLKEKFGQKPENYLFKFPKILFPLLKNQIEKLEKFNEHRKKIAQIYIDSGLKNFQINEQSDPIFLRFPIFLNEPEKLLEKFKKQNIYLGDWYRCVLAPCPKTTLEKFDYQITSCPKAESVTKKIINLPTFVEIDENQALEIINLLKNFKKYF